MQHPRIITPDDWWLLDRLGARQAKLEDLLQPERASELLSEHDLQVLQRETFWVNRAYRKYRFPMNVFLAANAVFFVNKYRNTRFRALPPRWRWAPGALAGAFAYGFAEFDSMAADYAFERGLKDPRAVHQSLQNLRTRIMQFIGEGVGEGEEVWRSTDDGDSFVTSSSSREFDPDASDTTNVRPNPPSSTAPQQQQRQQTPASPRTRWDEIRANSARNAIKTSSWDILREKREREQMASTAAANSYESHDSAPAAT